MLENDERDAVVEVLEVLRKAAHSGYIGEPVSQLTHALQCAHFAREAEASDELVLAALLHDIGHLVAAPGAPQMAGLGVLGHEDLGARYLLDRGFSPKVADLVRGHVQGKRYLTFKNPAYFRRLSDASRGTLEFQGGPMTEAEAREFEADPLFREKVQLRKLDELGKRTDLEVAPLESYREMMARNISGGTG